MEPQAETAHDQPPAPLAELELKGLQKSDKPINGEGSDKRKIETIRPWNNYTIVTLEGSDDIQILDEDAKPIKDFKALKNISVNWNDSNIENRIKKILPTCQYISRNPAHANNSTVLMLNKVPLELKAFAEKTLDSFNNIFKLYDQQQPIKLTTSNLTVISDKYVVFTSKEGAFFAFVTKNDQGIMLAPKNWKRLDPSSDVFPPELIKEVRKLTDTGYRKINESHHVLISDVGINIFKTEDSQGTPVFSENIPSIERNIVTDPSNPNVIYYCQNSNPQSVVRLDLSGETNTWKSVAAKFPRKYESVHNLQLDPTGNFFLFYSKEDLVVVTKDTLEEVKRVPNLTQVNFDSQGRIRAVDKDGYLVIYEPNFSEIAQELIKQRIANLAEGINIPDIFDLEASKRTQKGTETLEHLDPLRTKYQEDFKDVLAKITTQEGIQQIRQVGLNKLREVLQKQRLKPNEIDYIIDGLEEPITLKEKEFAVKGAQETLTSVRAKLTSGLSFASVSEVRAEMEKVRATEALLEEDL
ncbi:MAG TPA: hypothetical protein VF385_02095 [Patescibacteria group bacterium]